MIRRQPITPFGTAPVRWLGLQFCCAWLGVSSAMLAGCAAVRDFPAANLPPLARLVDAPSDDHRQRTADDIIVPVGSTAVSRPANVLVLSGGAMNGAFPAGLLTGWSESGARPRFDVVTGISTGALIAPFAFLGTECDADLERAYTSVKADQIYRLRFMLLPTRSLCGVESKKK